MAHSLPEGLLLESGGWETRGHEDFHAKEERNLVRTGQERKSVKHLWCGGDLMWFHEGQLLRWVLRDE